MLNSNLLNKINVNDEWYTPEYAIKPILEFLNPNFNFVENSWWNKKNHQYDNLKNNFV